MHEGERAPLLDADDDAVRELADDLGAPDLRQRLKLKKATQPLALASAGCVWKNPPGDVAARLIEKCGLKGKRVNGAEISSKHANFIVNRGGGTAADILALMDLTRERVHHQFGITLEPEIRVVGE